MSKLIAISVITPVYKGIKFLGATYACMQAQTFKDWEWILVDDESRDGSGALLDRFGADESRIRVVHQKNGGTSVARNTALKLARGKYLAFLDEDDLYHPNYLETLHHLAEKHESDITGCYKLEFNEQDTPAFSSEGAILEAEVAVNDRAAIKELAAKGKAGLPCEVWLNLYRRELFVDIPFPPGVRVEQDYWWHYLAMARCQKYVRIKWQGYAWRSTGAGGWLNPNPASLISHTRTIKMLATDVMPALELSLEQRRGFLDGLEETIHVVIFYPLKQGLKLNREESRQLRDGLAALYPLGVDVRHRLGSRKRFFWNLFLLTGISRVVTL